VNQVRTLDETAATRFLRDFRAVAGSGKKRVGLAVSGGPDSLALLLLAAETLDHVEAATVDHGLRPEAASEASYVSGIAKALAVRHSILTLPPKPPGNTSAWARKQRYAVLEKWADALELDLILTAHHADDQLETMLMRLNRGAGVGGMAGIRTLRGRIARPLMAWRKAELVALLKAQGIEAVDDPSNHDDRYDRARLRRALEQASWLDPAGAVRAGSALASADQALDWAADDYLSRRGTLALGIVSLDAKGLPHELVRRIVVKCMAQVVPEAAPRSDDLDRMIGALWARKVCTLAEVKCSGGDFWTFQKAPPRRKNERIC
jgi:tRNA(Ile)-lysidine synthase